jgi:hypothetical protein
MTRTLTMILSATLAAACASSGERVEFAASDEASSPELVVIAPDVTAVVGASEPVFRVNNAYWLYAGDRWYRSDGLHGPWTRIATPPRALARLDRPEIYANYRLDHRARTTPSATAQRERRDLPREVPQQPAPYANPLPPQQEPPVMPNGPGTTDRVPQDPTLPSQPVPNDSTTTPTARPEPDELSRPDRMRDR